MNKFFKNLEKGYPTALANQILWFTFGWFLGAIVKVILESIKDSKTK